MISGKTFSQEWHYVNSTGTTYILYGMSFPPGQSSVGYACGMQYTYDAPGVIVKTTDGGNNWSQIFPTSGTINGLQGIWFISEQIGFACGWNNYFIKTTDGGATWTPISVGNEVWYYTDVVFHDLNNGVAAGYMNNFGDQSVFITADGGNTWVPATSGVATSEITGLAYADQNTVYAVGTGNHVFKSTDGGHNFTTISTLSAMLFGVDFASPNFGVIGAEEKIFSTNNAGSSWATFTTGYELFSAVKTFSNGTAYVGGSDENIYKTTNYGAEWAMEFNGAGESHLYRIRFTDDGAGFACGSGGTILKYDSPISADFSANPTSACIGSPVNFTDLSWGNPTSWAWTFEGGNPATSTLQNPVVTYSAVGSYDVTLTVTNSMNSSTEVKANYITVVQTPAQANTPAGPSAVCGDGSYTYTTQSVPYAETYDWEVSPATAGTMVGTGTTATFEAGNTWSGSYTIKVRAVNNCGNGPWSTNFTGTLSHNPIEFSLQGDGGYCEGEAGFEIILDGSETSVEYELFHDEVSTGIIRQGTGSSLNFGIFSAAGFYTVTGFTDYCSMPMVGQLYVQQQALPGQAGVPSGDTEICNEPTSVYITSGASGATGYSWQLIPSNAGTLTPVANQVTVAWDAAFAGTAQLSVNGVNGCGDGPESGTLSISVGLMDAPVITGMADVCDNTTEIYTATEHAGSTYAWEINGGTIVSGNGTAVVNVMWGNAGQGAVALTETSDLGCEATADEFPVTIDECTGLGEGLRNTVQIFPNPTNGLVTIEGVNQNTISIYDLMGHEIMKLETVNNTLVIDMTGFNKGVYLVKVAQDAGTTINFLVKN